MECAENVRFDLSSLDKVKSLSWSDLLTALDDGTGKYSSAEVERVVEVLKTKTIGDVIGRKPHPHRVRFKVKSILSMCLALRRH